MDFAPYQSSPPEHARVFSPPSQDSARPSPRTSFDAVIRYNPFASSASTRPSVPGYSSPPLQHPQPQRAWSGDGIRSPVGGAYQSPFAGQQCDDSGSAGASGGGGMGDLFNALGAREAMVSEFDTSLGIRLDYEACLAYLALPPLGAIVLLILERNSDYVRFHAWQSSLLFTAMFVLHILFAWSTFFTWVLSFADLALILWLVMKAYRDADTLDRYEVPFVGPVASRILDDE